MEITFGKEFSPDRFSCSPLKEGVVRNNDCTPPVDLQNGPDMLEKVELLV